MEAVARSPPQLTALQTCQNAKATTPAGRAAGRELDAGVGLEHDCPSSLAPLAQMLRVTEAEVGAAIARLERDGHARFVQKQ